MQSEEDTVSGDASPRHAVDTAAVSQTSAPRFHPRAQDPAAVLSLHPGAKLAGADLSGQNLSNRDLSGVDLSGANLTDARLINTNLSKATLFGATLDRAHLLGADLTNADLTDISGTGAIFGSAKLAEATLFNANLTEATLTDADLTNADFRSANLTGARLRGAKLSHAEFRAANLHHADLSNASVPGADFGNASLRSAKMANVSGFADAHWIGVDISDVDFTSAYTLRRSIMDENYLYEFRHTSKKHEAVYHMWRITSDCGRSLTRWALVTLTVAVLFGALYSQVSLDYGDHETALSPFYFSVVTLTTLGYGDVLPASLSAQIVVLFEVLTGYIMLGGLLSIFATKMGRRAE